MKRKPIPKEIRKQVYNKYNGHCAYCGCELTYKEMQVDHLDCVRNNGEHNEIQNLMPSCRMCNYYKSTYTLEKFREQLELIVGRLNKGFTYRLAKKYNLIMETWQPSIQFYFEHFIIPECDKFIMNFIKENEGDVGCEVDCYECSVSSLCPHYQKAYDIWEESKNETNTDK